MTVVTGGQGSLLPKMVWVLEVPERPADMAKRWHNKYAKEALRFAMEKHHKLHIPDHFKRDARAKYGYKPRAPKYVRRKQRKYGTGGLDLVKTGRTRREMTSRYRLQLGGTAVGETLRATLRLWFPFKGKHYKGGTSGRYLRPGYKGSITIEQMRHEMEVYTQGEAAQIRDWFWEEYWRLVENHRSSRKRVRIT